MVNFCGADVTRTSAAFARRHRPGVHFRLERHCRRQLGFGRRHRRAFPDHAIAGHCDDLDDVAVGAGDRRPAEHVDVAAHGAFDRLDERDGRGRFRRRGRRGRGRRCGRGRRGLAVAAATGNSKQQRRAITALAERQSTNHERRRASSKPTPPRMTNNHGAGHRQRQLAGATEIHARRHRQRGQRQDGCDGGRGRLGGTHRLILVQAIGKQANRERVGVRAVVAEQRVVVRVDQIGLRAGAQQRRRRGRPSAARHRPPSARPSDCHFASGIGTVSSRAARQPLCRKPTDAASFVAPPGGTFTSRPQRSARPSSRRPSCSWRSTQTRRAASSRCRGGRRRRSPARARGSSTA